MPLPLSAAMTLESHASAPTRKKAAVRLISAPLNRVDLDNWNTTRGDSLGPRHLDRIPVLLATVPEHLRRCRFVSKSSKETCANKLPKERPRSVKDQCPAMRRGGRGPSNRQLKLRLLPDEKTFDEYLIAVRKTKFLEQGNRLRGSAYGVVRKNSDESGPHEVVVCAAVLQEAGTFLEAQTAAGYRDKHSPPPFSQPR